MFWKGLPDFCLQLYPSLLCLQNKITETCQELKQNYIEKVNIQDQQQYKMRDHPLISAGKNRTFCSLLGSLKNKKVL